VPDSRRPTLLRTIVVRTSAPELPGLNCTPVRLSGSLGNVPRSLNVASLASSRPPPATTMKGRPAAGAIASFVSGSTEVTVTSRAVSRPLPV
jgi:hypothetical protein